MLFSLRPAGAITCETAVPPIPPANSPQVAERLQLYQRYGNSLNAFLRRVFTAGVDKQITEWLQAQQKEIQDTLIWSGAKGELIDVVLTEPISGDQPGSLLYIENMGIGGCMMDVLIEAIDRPDATLRAAPPANFQISSSQSFLVWATLTSSKKVSYAVENPGSRGPLIDVALASAAQREALRQSAEARRTQQIIHLAENARTQAQSAEVRATISRSIKAMQDAAQKADKVSRDLQEALERQKAAAGAIAWLDIMSKVVTAAQLANQVNGLIAGEAPATVTAAVEAAGKTGDINQVRGVIVDWSTNTSQNVQQLNDQYSVLQSATTTQETYIIDTATKEGAPKAALPLKVVPP